MEGAVLDLWKLDKSRLPSRHDKAADNAEYDKLFQRYSPVSGQEISIEQGDSIFVDRLRGMDITAADVFEFAVQKQAALP